MPRKRASTCRRTTCRHCWQIFADYRFDVPYDDLPRDLLRLEAQLRENLPDWVCKDPELSVELFSSVLLPQRGRLPGRAHL